MESKQEVVDVFGELEAPSEVGQVKDWAQVEEETVVARRKELKSTPVDQLKRLVAAQGLDTGKKEDMAERLATQEAAARAEARAHQERVRKVFVDIKEELEGLSLPALKERCAEEGIKGAQLTKPARIEALIKQWQEDDGVDKALAKLAHEAREREFFSMDAAALQQLCEKAGVDPFVKEVMVDRIVNREHASGRFGKPTLERQSKEAIVSTVVGGDVVEALMASEANRKRERELKKHEEEMAAKKRVELNAWTLQDLRKQVTAAGRDASGARDELVEVLLQVGAQKEVVAKRKLELKALETVELKKMLQSKALRVATKKDEMVDTILAYEATVYESALAYNDKVAEVLQERKSEWEQKSAAELKEMCARQGLANGGNREACCERLLDTLRESDEVDQILAAKARSSRVAELKAKSKEDVLKVCNSLAINSLVKSVMVERLLSHEEEFGRGEEPKAKRARTSKNK